MSRVRPDRLELAGQTGVLRDALRASRHGERVFRNERLHLCLRYDASQGAFHENADLHGLLSWLIAHGVVFMERYGEAGGPAELMRLLQAESIVSRSFTSLIVRAPGDWELFEQRLR